MIIGYARVSTLEQNLNLQKDALLNAGCDKIFTDRLSGNKTIRPGLQKAISSLKDGDILVVWRLDRLGRSLKHLIEIVSELKLKGIGFKSLKENIDTVSSGGKLFFHIFGALAEFERDIIKERTMAGLAAARARGRLGGRPSVMDEKKLELAIELAKDFKKPIKDICQQIGVSKATLFRHLKSPLALEIQNRIKPKVIKVNLFLRIERNNKYVRGMKAARFRIESYCLSEYSMVKDKEDDWNYVLTIPYNSDKELDDIIYDLCCEMESIAESYNCWTEIDISEVDGERRW